VDRTLTIWFGACSSGQEPYSVAMLLRENFPELLGWKLNLYGVDISAEMVARSKEGRFSTIEVNRGLPAPLLMKYFKRDRASWVISDELRNLFHFSEGNLTGVWPAMPRIDIAFLRNVLIYFDVETKKQILRTLKTRMRPDGVMLLGGSETTLNLDPDFRRVTCGRTSYYALVPLAERAPARPASTPPRVPPTSVATPITRVAPT